MNLTNKELICSDFLGCPYKKNIIRAFLKDRQDWFVRQSNSVESCYYQAFLATLSKQLK